MHRAARTALILALAAALCAPAGAADRLTTSTPDAIVDRTRSVDVVVILDLSGSMEQLLDATRARTWDVVNELARLSPTPELRVGLVTYGTERATEADGWVKMEIDLTTDLDAVYGKLMELETAGGEEYLGRALEVALDQMSWARDWDGLRLIFVAGNEPVEQGELDFRLVARDARDDDIIINTLYAGPRDQAVVEKWPEVAREGGGSFSSIDPERSSIQIAAPQDARLLELNTMLNATYLPYGPEGAAGLANQVAQDSNASRLGVESCSSRIAAKGTKLYTNAHWDLVDAAGKEEFRLDDIATDELPEAMRGMTREQRLAWIDEHRVTREAIQEEIQALAVERERHVHDVLARQRTEAGLGEAMREAIRGQARAKGFKDDDC